MHQVKDNGYFKGHLIGTKLLAVLLPHEFYPSEKGLNS